MPTVNINNSNCAVDLRVSSGGERTRTADFHVANVALYQLSYTPGVTGDGPSARILWSDPAESGQRLRLAEPGQTLLEGHRVTQRLPNRSATASHNLVVVEPERGAEQIVGGPVDLV